VPVPALHRDGTAPTRAPSPFLPQVPSWSPHSVCGVQVEVSDGVPLGCAACGRAPIGARQPLRHCGRCGDVFCPRAPCSTLAAHAPEVPAGPRDKEPLCTLCARDPVAPLLVSLAQGLRAGSLDPGAARAVLGHVDANVQTRALQLRRAGNPGAALRLEQWVGRWVAALALHLPTAPTEPEDSSAPSVSADLGPSPCTSAEDVMPPATRPATSTSCLERAEGGVPSSDWERLGTAEGGLVSWASCSSGGPLDTSSGGEGTPGPLSYHGSSASTQGDSDHQPSVVAPSLSPLPPKAKVGPPSEC
jgi:hypothetical protein